MYLPGKEPENPKHDIFKYCDIALKVNKMGSENIISEEWKRWNPRRMALRSLVFSWKARLPCGFDVPCIRKKKMTFILFLNTCSFRIGSHNEALFVESICNQHLGNEVVSPSIQRVMKVFRNLGFHHSMPMIVIHWLKMRRQTLQVPWSMTNSTRWTMLLIDNCLKMRIVMNTTYGSKATAPKMTCGYPHPSLIDRFTLALPLAYS